MASAKSLADLTVEDFFGYWPSLALAVAALVLYGLGAAGSTFMTARTRRWFLLLVSITGFLEAGGYAALVYMIERTGEANLYGAYVTFQVLTILPPNLLQAADYITVGRVLAASPGIARGRRRLSARFVSVLFTTSDVVALVVQALGTALWATAKSSTTPSQSQISTGNYIMLAGLAMQILFFAGFTVLAVWVHRHPKNTLKGTAPSRRLFLGLYASIVLLFVRNIFRLVEFAQATAVTFPVPPGQTVIAENQTLFYVFDTLMILLCMLCFTLFYPGLRAAAEAAAAADAKPASAGAGAFTPVNSARLDTGADAEKGLELGGLP